MSIKINNSTIVCSECNHTNSVNATIPKENVVCEKCGNVLIKVN